MKKSKRPFKRWKKTIKADRDWDYSYLWALEYQKIKNLLGYWIEYSKKSGGYHCSDDKTAAVLRELRWAKALLEIMLDGDGGVWEIKHPGFDSRPSTDRPGCWELIEKPGIIEADHVKRLRYFNYRNCSRFFEPKAWESREETIRRCTAEKGDPCFIRCHLENDGRLEKARYLYHRLRYLKETGWWE